MKIYYISIVLFSMLFIMSCGNKYETSDYFDLEELPGYVAFNASGNDAFLAPFDVNEGSAAVDISVENPTGTSSDITVNYTFGGTAEYGVDFTDPNGSAAGGSITIPVEVGADFNVTFQAPIMLEILDDAVFDQEKTILVTLESASNAEGALAVGRGGLDFLKTAIVNIADDECDSNYGGSFAVATTTDSIMIDGMLTDSTETFTGSATIAKVDGEFFTYSIDDASGGFYASDFVGEGALPVTIVEDCGAITEVNGSSISLVSGAVGADGVITLTLKDDTTGNQFTSVFTPN